MPRSNSPACFLAGCLVPALLGTALVSSGIPAAAEEPVEVPSGVPTAAEATALAMSSGSAVEVTSATTPTELITALPNGSFRLQSDTLPVRVETADGWAPLDTNLVYDAETDSWGPNRVPSEVRFSAGGNGMLAEIATEAADWLTESWKYGDLPKPTIDGATASYKDVLPGANLHLTATPSGMSQVLEITTPKAAEDPRLDAWTIPVDGAELTELPDGSISAAIDGDDQAFVGGTPQWWDSADKHADESEPGLNSAIRPVAQDVTEGDVVLRIGDLAATPGVVFPVFVDPDWTTGSQQSWYTDRKFPTTSYLTSPSILRIGYDTTESPAFLSRAFWEFNTTAIAGKHVLGAQFTPVQNKTYHCNYKDVEMWRYGPAGAGFTWNQDPQAWAQKLDVQSVSYGNSCRPAQGVPFNAVGGAAWAAAAGSGVLQLGLRVVNEGDSLTRSHWDRGATLRVDYNTIPNAPTGSTFASPVRSCGSSGSPAYMHDSSGITLQSTASDSDGGNLKTTFTVSNNATGVAAWSGAVGAQAQGAARVQVPPQTLAAETLYRWEARSEDALDTSAPSASCYFMIDRTAPPSPTIIRPTTSTGAPQPKPRVGKADTVEFQTSQTDRVSRIGYWWAYGNPSATPAAPVSVSFTEPGRPCGSVDGAQRFACTDALGTVSRVTVAPVDTVATLWAVSYDQAGNVSPAARYSYLSNDSSVDVSFVAGHGWNTANSPASLQTISDEQDPNSGIEPRIALNLETGPTKPKLFDPFNETVEVITASGYTSIARTRNGTTGDHATVMEGTPAAGYQFERDLGRIPATQTSGTPANTKPLYLCVLAGSEGMTSPSSTCEGTGVTGTPIGYIWTVAPGGSVPLYRCRISNDHFDSLDAGCEGQIVEATLGYVMPVRYNRTSGPAVNPNYSFSISAWMNFNPTATPLAARNFTALSQNGPVHSDYFLQIDANKKWRFCIRSQTNGSLDCATSPTTVTNNQWVFVTGIWDSINQQVRLVISQNSVTPVALVSHTPAAEEPASGDFTVGSSKASGAYVNNWNGYILRPTAFNGVVSQAQLNALSNLAPPQ